MERCKDPIRPASQQPLKIRLSHRQRAQIVAIERQDIVMTTGEPFPDRKIAYRIGIRKCERFDFCGYHYGISEHTVGMRDTFEDRAAVAQTIAY
jgi:hypothetical protein